MSFQAMTWAASLKWGGCSGRATIYAIANNANDQYFCWAKQETLAEESEQSTDSVQRRISEFVAEGQVRRIKLKRFGRRTHDFLILQPSRYFEAPIEEIEPFLPRGCDIMAEVEKHDEPAPHAAANCGSVEGEEIAAPPAQPAADAAANCGCVVHGSTLPQPAAHATALVRQQEPDLNLKKESPQSPPYAGTPVENRNDTADGEAASGLAMGASGQREGSPQRDSQGASPQGQDHSKAPEPSELAQRLAKQLAAFRSAYPEPSNRPGEVAAAFAALDEDGRRLAVRAAIGAGAVRQKTPRKPMVDQLKFLRDRELLAEYARLAPAEVEFATLTPATAEWRACVLMRNIIGMRPVEIGTELRVRPPVPDARQLAGLDWSDRSGWVVIERDTKQFVAWAGLAKKWTGHWPDAQTIWLDDADRPVPQDQAATVVNRMPNGSTFTTRKRTAGLVVPAPWPPRKDGTLATGPPEEAPSSGRVGAGGSLMSDADWRYISDGRL